MADERLRFIISSETKGDGFTKAENSVKAVSAGIGKATGITREAIGELGKMDGVLGQIADSTNAVIQSIQRFGTMGAVFGSVKLAVDYVVKDLEEFGDQLLHNMDVLNSYQAKLKSFGDNAAIRRMADAMKDATTNAQEAMNAIERTAAAVNALAGAKGESAAAAAQERMAALIKEKAEAVAGALGQFEKSVASASSDLKIAQFELEEATRAAAAEVEKSKRDYQTAIDKQMQAAENLANAQYAVQVAENDYKKAKQHGAVSLAEYERTVEAARKAELAATAAKAKADNDVAVALEKQTAAESKQTAAVLKGEAKVVDLTAARDEAVRKLNEETAKEETLGAETGKLAEARKAEAERARRESEEVKRKGEEQIKAINENIKALEAQKEALEKVRKSVDRAEANYLKHHEWMGEGWERNENGSLKNFKDFVRAERWADRADRDAAGNRLYNERQQARADDIQRKLENGRYVSDADKKFLDQWKKFNEQLQGEEDIDKQISDWKERQLKVAEDTKEVLDSIKKSLEEQGLK